MGFHLDSFDSQFPDEVLDRGYGYYELGLIEIFFWNERDIQAKAYGSHTYLVKLQLADDFVKQTSCTCPYDYGIYCKHIAALCFLLTEDSLEPEHRNVPKQGENQSLIEILEKMDVAELRSFLQQATRYDDQLARQLLSRYGYLLLDQDPKYFHRLVKEMVSTYQVGRDYFIDYYASDALAHDAEEMMLGLNPAGPGALGIAYLAEAMIKQLVKAIQHADDSNGGIGEAISTAFNLLETVAEQGSEKAKDYVYQLAKKEWNKALYEDYSWNEDWLRLQIALLPNERHADTLLTVLQKQLRKLGKQNQSFMAEQIACEILRIMGEWKPLALQLEFQQAYLRYPQIRTLALEQAMGEKDFAKVRQLAEDGLREANGHQGLIEEWQEWLREMARITQNTEEWIRLTELQFLKNRKISDYRDMKAMMQPGEFAKKSAQWYAYFQAQSKGKWFYRILAEICIEEERWSELMRMLRNFLSYDLLDEFLPFLREQYAHEFPQLYAQAIEQHMIETTGRRAYQEACKYLRKIHQMGGQDDAFRLISWLRESFPRRRALMEELDQVERKWRAE